MEQRKSLFKISTNNLIKTIVLPIFLIFIIASSLIMRYSVRDKINTNESLLYQLADASNRNLEIVSISTANIYSNYKVHNLLREYTLEENSYSKSVLSNSIGQIIGANLSYITAYKSVIIDLKNGDRYVYGSLSYSDISTEEFLNGENVKYDEVNLINDHIQNNDVILVIPIEKKATIVDKITVVVDKNLFISKSEIFNNNIEEIKIIKNYKANKNFSINYKDGNFYYTRYKPLDKFNLSVVVNYNLSSIISIIVSTGAAIIIGAFIILISIYFYYKNYSKNILTPILETVDGINLVEKTEEFKPIFKESNVNEINNLNRYLNKLVKKINELLKENQKINDEKLEIEIATLQSQITPHFIFNTLNSIRIQALINDDKEVANSIKNFTSLIKNNFSKGNIHTFKDEELVIESYFNIMKIRYGDKIKYNINLEKSLEDKKLLKLLLQPIIENSIIHGLSAKNYDGIVDINMYEEGNNVIVKIRDNGIGISKENIEKIMNGESNGIGVYNCNRRIKVYYGDDYGIDIKSELGSYTETIVKLPSI